VGHGGKRRHGRGRPGGRPGPPVPAAFAAKIAAREGRAGRDWVDRLPGIVRGLLDRWSLELDGAAWHGETAIVLPVRHAAGGSEAPRALKVRWLDPFTRDEGLALRAWNGLGAVRLYDEAPEAGALLLERLDPHRSLLDVPETEAVDVAAGLLRRLAIPAPEGVRAIRTEVDEMAGELRRRRETAGWPSPDRLERLLGLAAELGSTGQGLLVDADLHYENVLAATREPWLVIDPKVVAGDLEFGVAPLLWNRAGELGGPEDLEARLARLVDGAKLDAERARLWSIVRLVDVAVWSLSTGVGRHVDACRRLLDWLEWERLVPDRRSP